MTNSFSTINFVVTPEIEKKVQDIARREQRSVSAQLRVMIQDWFRTQEKKRVETKLK